MDLSSLAEVGKVAGVAGVAIGMIVLLVRPIVDRSSSLPRAERGPLFRLIAIGSFAIGGLGIVAWLVAGLTRVPIVGPAGNCNIQAGGIGSGGNSTNCGPP